MSLEPEKLKELIDVQKQTLELVKQVLDVVAECRAELGDKLEDMEKELQTKIHSLDSFARNILEVNQKTIWKKLLELEGEEAEQLTEP